VLAGEGRATLKIDGTCCLIRNGVLYKRRELRSTETMPTDFELIEGDTETGKMVGWVPVGNGPEDQWHREAYAWGAFEDGTYELVGPKIQGNPEKALAHHLLRHGNIPFDEQPPRTFDALRDWCVGMDMEGIVWHHPDGRMAKIKLRDFGLKRI